MTNIISNNIPDNQPTPFEVQDRSKRCLNKVLTIHIYKKFDTLQEQLAVKDYVVKN